MFAPVLRSSFGNVGPVCRRTIIPLTHAMDAMDVNDTVLISQHSLFQVHYQILSIRSATPYITEAL